MAMNKTLILSLLGLGAALLAIPLFTARPQAAQGEQRQEPREVHGREGHEGGEHRPTGEGEHAGRTRREHELAREHAPEVADDSESPETQELLRQLSQEMETLQLSLAELRRQMQDDLAVQDQRR